MIKIVQNTYNITPKELTEIIRKSLNIDEKMVVHLLDCNENELERNIKFITTEAIDLNKES